MFSIKSIGPATIGSTVAVRGLGEVIIAGLLTGNLLLGEPAVRARIRSRVLARGGRHRVAADEDQHLDRLTALPDTGGGVVGRLRRLASSSAVVGVMLVVGLAGWVGAFAGDGGHHLGESAGPGTLIPRGEDRPPDEHELREADLLHSQTVAAVAKYADPAVAAADGGILVKKVQPAGAGKIAASEFAAA